MALALLSPAVRHLRRPLNSPPLARTTTSNTGFSFFTPSSSPASRWYSLQRTSSAGSGDGAVLSEAPGDRWLDADLLRRISGAGDADQALDIIAESVGGADSGRSRASLDASDCHAILAAALDRGNVDLALSVFEGMRSGFSQGECWSWARPDARTYALLVQRLAAALRVSDAIRIIDYVSGAGVSSAEEVPFGITVRCPTCTVAIAVAQPQHGTQDHTQPSAARYSSHHSWINKCTENDNLVRTDTDKLLFSNNRQTSITYLRPRQRVFLTSRQAPRWFLVLSAGTNMNYFPEKLQASSLKKLGSPPAERSMDISALEKTLRFINVMKDDLPAAVHSILIQTPSGIARTHRFATKTVELPAQEGERVTISSAAPTNAYREMGPLKIAARSKGFRPGEPMCLTNHISGQVSKLLRAPSKNAGPFVLTPYLFVGALALLASGDAVSAFIDPSLPRLITATVIASAAVGTTLNQVILPETRKLPQKAVDIVAVRQQLLSQYDMLQSRLKDLKQLAEKEVWMLARMCRLENKILSVGEPSYRARRGRVKRVRKSLETTLSTKIELMESYAKLCSMIEIEVEMDSDVIVAEAASGAERISEQIQQLMEIDGLEEQWRIQAEANDEAERLLSSDSSEALSAENV